jgi:serine/threonine protein kinase
MIHRDVKPANLMIDSDGRVVLTDFGIAKIVTGNQFTASGGMVGTPAYMAPEQGLGEAGDERSDLYSLGVILFQLATGRLPYDAETPLAVILKHLNEDIPIPHEINLNVPTAIEAVILKAMAKDQDDRFQSADEMKAQINSITGTALTDTGPIPIPPRLSDETATRTPPGSEPPSLSTSTAITPPRRPTLAGLGAIAAIALIGVIGLMTLVTGKVPGLGIAIRATDTATFTATPHATQTPIVTTTVPIVVPPTATETSTATATNTATLSPTNTPTATATNTPTATYTPSRTPTATPNITATIEAGTQAIINITATSKQATVDAFFLTPQGTSTPDYTATAQLCVKEYRQRIEKAPEKDPIKANTDFKRQIVLRNTGNCDWLPGMYLNYVSGEKFGVAHKLEMKNTEPVKPNQDAVFDFDGHTPRRGGLYSSVWEVRLAGDILLDPPLTISFFAYE